LCPCGSQREEHLPYCEPPAPLLAPVDVTRKMHHRCPGKDTQLRGGMLREPPSTSTRDWFGLRVPVTEVTERVQEDRVPRRRAESAEELAGAATTLGRKALSYGFVVDAYFRELHDGVQWSILAFARDTGERGIGVWRRTAGGKWTFRSAAWGASRTPVSAARLKELIMTDMQS
jgi:hypothetical protein